jgi:hypothetical protein
MKDRNARYEEIKSGFYDLASQKAELESKMAKLLVEKAQIELYPFVEGQIVKCVVPAGRTKKEQRCQVEIDDSGQVWVRPIGDDGNLRGRRFKAILEDGKDYTSIFKEVDR